MGDLRAFFSNASMGGGTCGGRLGIVYTLQIVASSRKWLCELGKTLKRLGWGVGAVIAVVAGNVVGGKPLAFSLGLANLHPAEKKKKLFQNDAELLWKLVQWDDKECPRFTFRHSVECFERHPLWFKYFPKTMRQAQRNAERLLFRYGRKHEPSSLILSYFQQFPPVTLEGWRLFARAEQDENGSYSDTFVSGLKEFWAEDTTLSPQDTRKFWKVFRPFFQEADWHKRLQLLLWNGKGEDLRKLLEKESKTDLWAKAYVRCSRLIEKNPPEQFQEQPVVGGWGFETLWKWACVRQCLNKGWLEKALMLFAELETFSGDCCESQKEALWTLRRRLSRELLQRANSLRAHHHSQESVAPLFLHAIRLLTKKTPPANSKPDEELNTKWFVGWLWFHGLRDATRALEIFSEGLRETKYLPYPYHDRYVARFAYWMGTCWEYMGNREQASVFYARASHYPFFFYGQLACAKINTQPCLAFSQSTQNQEHSLSLEERRGREKARNTIINVLRVWHNAACRAWGKKKRTADSHHPAIFRLLQELSPLLDDPKIARMTLDLVKIWSPGNVTFFAKGLTASPASTFPEAYPTVQLPHHSLDPAIFYAIILQETAFNHQTVSPAGARGLMQMMPDDARAISKKLGLSYSEKKLFDRAFNMRLGVYHLENFFKRFRGSNVLAFASYNAGESKARRWLGEFPTCTTIEDVLCFIESIPYSETRTYVQKILENRIVYRWRLSQPYQNIFMFLKL